MKVNKNTKIYIGCWKSRKKKCKCGKIICNISTMCLSCSHKGKNGEEASRWKGGIRDDGKGYILIYKPEHPFCNKQKYVREHRLVVEKELGRYLKKEEIVHHINGIRNDNRLENLVLIIKNKHEYQTLLKLAQRRIKNLEKENYLLKAKINV